jgi:hypothetical protein
MEKKISSLYTIVAKFLNKSIYSMIRGLIDLITTSVNGWSHNDMDIMGMGMECMLKPVDHLYGQLPQYSFPSTMGNTNDMLLDIIKKHGETVRSNDREKYVFLCCYHAVDAS